MLSAAVYGIDASLIEVEVDVAATKTEHDIFTTVGLPDATVRESRERIRAALKNSGYDVPPTMTTINLAPADIRKEGSGFDLPMALGILGAYGGLNTKPPEDALFVGELSLDGGVRAIRGALPIAVTARANNIRKLIVPATNAREAALVEGVDVYPVQSLIEVVQLLNKGNGVLPVKVDTHALLEASQQFAVDFRDVRGQQTAKRAIEIAAAGGHNLLMIGPPGAGKSMLASSCACYAMPEVSMVHSLAGELMGGKLASERPFRAPHHSASMAALVGGGTRPKPGEVSLAHLGVLFLDELPEFQPGVLDALRQPLESGETIIARANHRIAYPSRIQLVAAMNPCKCGAAGPGASCKRGPRCAAEYQARISGPLLDRIDLQIEVPALSAADLLLPAPAEGSAEVRARVTRAREVQRERFVALGARAMRTNADCSGRILEEIATPYADGVALLRQAADALRLSARGFPARRPHADLDGAERVARVHVAEALSYRGETLRRSKAA